MAKKPNKSTLHFPKHPEIVHDVRCCRGLASADLNPSHVRVRRIKNFAKSRVLGDRGSGWACILKSFELRFRHKIGILPSSLVLEGTLANTSVSSSSGAWTCGISSGTHDDNIQKIHQIAQFRKTLHTSSSCTLRSVRRAHYVVRSVVKNRRWSGR